MLKQKANKRLSDKDLPDTARIKQLVEKNRKNIISFLKDLVSIPSESCQEKAVIERIAEEMRKLKYDDVTIDKMGNIIGRIGNGKRIIAMDSHVDTVGPGDLGMWHSNPFIPVIKSGRLYGRGAVDQKAGMVGTVYAGGIIRELNLTDDYTLFVVGSVQEEDCDGLCWHYIIKEDGLTPECVVLTEPTSMNLNIGHRGRMEIDVRIKGRSAHGSMPHLGDNAIYSMSRMVEGIKNLNENLASDDFLGKGTAAVTRIFSKSPSLCAVPDECKIHIDRRLTVGEDKNSALTEIGNVAENAGLKADIEIPVYSRPGYRGLEYSIESYFPTWLLSREHPLLRSAEKAFSSAFSREPKISRWVFSTNGVATMGHFGIPTIGFGPGDEKNAHAPDEFVPIDEVLDSVNWYALFPGIYTEIMEEKNNG